MCQESANVRHERVGLSRSTAKSLVLTDFVFKEEENHKDTKTQRHKGHKGLEVLSVFVAFVSLWFFLFFSLTVVSFLLLPTPAFNAIDKE
jgi:hypothetical protein